MIYCLGIVFGIAYGFYFPLMTTKTLKSMPKQEQALANNLVLAAEDTGFAIGGTLWSIVAVAVGGYRNIYVISTTIALAMLVLVVVYPTILKKRNISESRW